MKRNMGLICEILRRVENHGAYGDLYIHDVDGHERDVVAYHVHLCVQAGFIEANGAPRGMAQTPQYEISGLTWAGHERLHPSMKHSPPG